MLDLSWSCTFLWNHSASRWGSTSDALRETGKFNIAGVFFFYCILLQIDWQRQIHLVIWVQTLSSVFLLSFSPFNVLRLLRAVGWLILPAAQAWESVDTFLRESAALNFWRNVWTDTWNWTSSGQPFIWVFCTNSHEYKDKCDCVKELLIFLMWIILGSLKCHFRQSLLLSTIKKNKKQPWPLKTQVRVSPNPRPVLISDD